MTEILKEKIKRKFKHKNEADVAKMVSFVCLFCNYDIRLLIFMEVKLKNGNGRK